MKRVRILSVCVFLVVVSLLLVACAKRVNTGAPVTPWEQVMIDNDILAQANNSVEKAVINVGASMPDKLPTEKAAKIIFAQKKIARVHVKLTNLLNQGPTIVRLSDVQPLIDEIRQAASEMVGSGDLNIVDPQSQVTIQSYVSTIGNMATGILSLTTQILTASRGAVDDAGAPVLLLSGAAPVPDPSNPAGLALLIAQLIALALSTAPIVAADIVKLRKLLTQADPNVQANLKAVFDDTIATDQDTIATADQWFIAHGLDPETGKPLVTITDVSQGSIREVTS